MWPASGHTRFGSLSSAGLASLWHPSAEGPGAAVAAVAVAAAVAAAAAAAASAAVAPSLPQASPTDWHGSEPEHGPTGTLGLNLSD